MLQYSSSQAPSAKGILTSLGLVAYTGPLFWLNSGAQSLIGSDEGYYAQMAREMVVSGHWLTPTFLGVPWFEKPPLNQWLIAASFSVFGISEWSARLPSAVAAIFGVLLTYWIGRTLVGERRALLGALVLPTCYLWMFYGRLAVGDVILTTLELAGLACLLAASARRQWPALGWGIALGLGVLLKSGMILLAAAAVLPWLIFAHREHRLLTNPYLHLGILLGIGFCTAWYGSATQLYGAKVPEGLFGMLSVLSKKDFHAAGPFYYFWNLPGNTFPWTFFALCGGWAFLRERKSPLLLLGYPLVLFALLQVFATKTPYYLIQICPFLALLAGLWLDVCLQSRVGSALRVTSLLVGAVGLLLVVTGIALYLNPSLVPGIETYLPSGLGFGLLWLAAVVVFLMQRVLVPWRTLWAACVIGGPWCALTLAGIVTSVGNYSPEFKAFRERLATYVEPNRPITFVYENNGSRVSELIALAFYTPTPGRSLDAAQVAAVGDPVWWLAPESRARLDAVNFAYEPLAEVSGWTLARRPQAPAMARTVAGVKNPKK